MRLLRLHLAPLDDNFLFLFTY